MQKGSGKSGLIPSATVDRKSFPEPHVNSHPKASLPVFFIGFPANGRTINAPELEKILFDFLPACVENTFFYKNINHGRTGTNQFFSPKINRQSGEQLKAKKTGGICCRWCYTPTGKWYFLPSDEAFCPVYFSRIAPCNYESSA